MERESWLPPQSRTMLWEVHSSRLWLRQLTKVKRAEWSWAIGTGLCPSWPWVFALGRSMQSQFAGANHNSVIVLLSYASPNPPLTLPECLHMDMENQPLSYLAMPGIQKGWRVEQAVGHLETPSGSPKFNCAVRRTNLIAWQLLLLVAKNKHQCKAERAVCQRSVALLSTANRWLSAH